MIPLSECIKGHVYKVKARNFEMGVFDGKTGFIGIRTKFGSRYLDTEYHWDSDDTHGTCQPLEDIGALPKGEGVEVVTGWWVEQSGASTWLYNGELFEFLEKL